MTTEQMDWVDDERAGRPHRGAPIIGLHVPSDPQEGMHLHTAEDVEHMAAVELHTPLAAGALQAFVDTLPAQAVVKISPAMRVEGYRIEASW